MIKEHFLYKRKIIVATKHQKEKIIAPLLQEAFASICEAAHNLDTDVLGTFTGEIERSLNPLETARKKCSLALYNFGYEVAISTEGSFGAHPSLPFIHANTELVMLVDKKNKYEFWHQEISTNTNFNGQYVSSFKDLQTFCKAVKFPSHAVILRESSHSKNHIFKGITSYKALKQCFFDLKQKYKSVYVETDMRALYNPSRQLIIKKAVEKLIQKINSLCPHCAKPGFSINMYVAGLPCEQCHSATNSTLYHEFACDHCGYTLKKMFPNQKQFEDPLYCNYCNP